MAEIRWEDVIEELVQTEGWPLAADGMAALANELRRRIDDSSPISTATMRTMVLNLYQDGPTVQQMSALDSAAGEEHWQQWRQQMLRAAQKEGLSAEEAEDFVQQIFPGVQRSLKNFKFKASLKTFFAAIFRRQFAKWLQTQKYQQVQTEALGEEAPLTAAATTTAAVVENAAIHTLVSQEIQKILKSEDYQILYWYYVEEDTVDPVTKEVVKWTDKAIGEQLGMPLNTVTARRTRALARLRQHHRLRQLFQDLLEMDQPNEDST